MNPTIQLTLAQSSIISIFGILKRLKRHFILSPFRLGFDEEVVVFLLIPAIDSIVKTLALKNDLDTGSHPMLENLNSGVVHYPGWVNAHR